MHEFAACQGKHRKRKNKPQTNVNIAADYSRLVRLLLTSGEDHFRVKKPKYRLFSDR